MTTDVNQEDLFDVFHDAFEDETPQGIMERAFWLFHEKNPDVFRHLRHYAFEWRNQRGPRAMVSISMLRERVRWEISLETGETPKISNSHSPFYARLLMERHSMLAGIFKLKRQKVQTSFGPINADLEPNVYIGPVLE